MKLISLTILLFPLLAGALEVPQSRLDALGTMPPERRLASIEKLMERYPSDSRLTGLWSDAYWQSLDGLEASAKIETLKASLREDPDNGTISKLLGDAFFDHAHHEGGNAYLDSALFAYENAALKMPDYLPAIGSVGSLYDDMEDYDQAVFWYRRALEVDPDHVPTLVNLGASLYNKGDSNGAMDAYRRALAVDPDSQDARYNLGVAFAEAQLYREAVVEWERVVGIDPGTAIAQQAASNAKLLKDVLAETVYKGGRKIRRSDTTGEAGEPQGQNENKASHQQDKREESSEGK